MDGRKRTKELKYYSTEEEIFKFLNYPYKNPNERI